MPCVSLTPSASGSPRPCSSATRTRSTACCCGPRIWPSSWASRPGCGCRTSRTPSSRASPGTSPASPTATAPITSCATWPSRRWSRTVTPRSRCARRCGACATSNARSCSNGGRRAPPPPPPPARRGPRPPPAAAGPGGPPAPRGAGGGGGPGPGGAAGRGGAGARRAAGERRRPPGHARRPGGGAAGGPDGRAARGRGGRAGNTPWCGGAGRGRGGSRQARRGGGGGGGRASRRRGAGLLGGGGGEPQRPPGGGAVVLDYCAAVRGILNDDQGGPLDPPGLRMAEALGEVRASLQRNLELQRPGSAHGQLQRLAGCIDRGLQQVQAEQQQVKEQVQELRRVAATLEEGNGTRRQRQHRYEQLQQEYEQKGGTFYGHLAGLMLGWLAGLFVKVRAGKGEELPPDNLDLERWFRRPKGHERRIHGRRHAGVRIVQEGPTLRLTLDAHEAHPGPFTAEELLPYRHAEEPPDQQEALHRRKVMRKARSKKNDNPCSKS